MGSCAGARSAFRFVLNGTRATSSTSCITLGVCRPTTVRARVVKNALASEANNDGGDVAHNGEHRRRRGRMTRKAKNNGRDAFTCLSGGGHDGRRRRPVPETVDGRYGELVLGVRAQRPYRVVHGHHAADDARRLGRGPRLVRYRVVLYVVRVGVRPAELDRRGSHVRHFDVGRRTGQRYNNNNDDDQITRRI